MQAILLAGGLGTRMREETEFIPKPMVEIGGRPVLWHVMKGLSCHGIEDFIIATGYKHEVIRDYFINYETRHNDFSIVLGDKSSLEFFGEHEEATWKVTLAYTGEETHTGGRVSLAAAYLEDADRPFLVTYGDGVANVDVTSLMSQHSALRPEVTLTAVRPSSRFGVLEIGDGDAVKSFDEKPVLDGWINIGFFVMEPVFLERLQGNPVLEEGPLETVAELGGLRAFRHDGFWQPMDTYREYLILNEMWNQGVAPWKTW